MNNNIEIQVVDYNNKDNLPLIQLVINFLQDDIIPINREPSNINLFGFQTKKQYIEYTYQTSDFWFVGFGEKGDVNNLVEDYYFLLYILSLFKNFGNLYRDVKFEDNKYTEKVLVGFRFKGELKTIELNYKSENIEGFYHMYSLLALKSIVYQLLFELHNNNITLTDIKNEKL